MMHENPPKRCTGETENWRESGCRNTKRLGNDIDPSTVNADSDQQDGRQVVERGAQDVKGFLRGSGEGVSPLMPLIKGFRHKYHWSPLGRNNVRGIQ